MFHYMTVANMNHDIIHNLLPKIPKVELVVAIPRDGILAGILVSLYRNIPFCTIDEFCNGKISLPGIKHRKAKDFNTSLNNILVIDDMCATGRGMKDAKERLAALNYRVNYIFAVVYAFKAEEKMSLGMIDAYAKEISSPLHYEWTFGDNVFLSKYIMDIDGILCDDCPREDDDDGERYLNFLRNAKLKLRPVEVGTLITWRDEKYREQTEEWLNRHDIKFNKLVMADRSKWANAIQFKADYYKNNSGKIFLESSSHIARKINDLVGKPVIGLDTNELFDKEN